MLAPSKPDQGYEADRPGPSENFRGTIRQSGKVSPGQPRKQLPGTRESDSPLLQVHHILHTVHV